MARRALRKKPETPKEDQWWEVYMEDLNKPSGFFTSSSAGCPNLSQLDGDYS